MTAGAKTPLPARSDGLDNVDGSSDAADIMPSARLGKLEMPQLRGLKAETAVRRGPRTIAPLRQNRGDHCEQLHHSNRYSPDPWQGHRRDPGCCRLDADDFRPRSPSSPRPIMNCRSTAIGRRTELRKGPAPHAPPRQWRSRRGHRPRYRDWNCPACGRPWPALAARRRDSGRVRRA
jgi:hypothetical protein